jgi:hypothetical protein
MIKTKTKSLASDFNSLFAKLIRQRSYLIRTEKSQKNEALVRNAIDRTMPYKVFVFSDRGAALFIIKHKEDLRVLIPETQKNTIEHFDDLLWKAKKIINS